MLLDAFGDVYTILPVKVVVVLVEVAVEVDVVVK